MNCPDTGGCLRASKSSPDVVLDWGIFGGSGNFIVRRGIIGDFGNYSLIFGPSSLKTCDDAVLEDTTSYWYDNRNRSMSDTLYFYHADHLGTPIAMTDTSGTLVWRAEHAPFGSIYALTVSTINNNLRFPGQYFDSETALAQNWFRDYDAKIGRYWEFDPVNKLLLGYYCGVLKIKLPIFDMNFPYSYAALNPVVMIDFAGLREFSCTYYQKRHKESGCSYYKWAANICEKFRSGEPYGHKITVCIGNCLQDYDKRYCPKKCCAGVFLCNVAAGHQACYSLCFATLGGLP